MQYLIHFSEYLDKINEGLIKTYPGDFTCNKVKTEMNLMNCYLFDIDYIISSNTITLSLYNFNTTDLIQDKFNHINSMIINRYGWYPSIMTIVNLSGMTNTMAYDEKYLIKNNIYFKEIKIDYESKYDLEENLPNKLYHLSILEFKDKINKLGLIPKSKSKLSNHLDRIYVCSNINDCKKLIPRMQLHYSSKNLKINSKWVLYEIDANDLKNKLYKDPNFENGYYIIENIPPDKIKVIDYEK